MANTVWLKDVDSGDVGIIGQKASKISSLYQNSFTVPFSFIITIQAYQYFLDNKSLIKDINKILDKTEPDRESIVNASESIQELILNCDVPDSIKEDITYNYSHMNLDTDVLKMLNKNTLNFIKAGRDFPYLALRPSFNINGLKAKYFLNVKGKENLVSAIKNIWASVFNPDNIPIIKDHKLEDIGIAIIAQKMINSDKYAVVNVNSNELKIDCVYGLGESFNITTPDSYIVNTSSLEVMNKVMNKQDAMFIRDDNYGRTIRKNLINENSTKEKLNPDEIKKITNFSLNVYNYFNKNVSVELALEAGKFYLIDVNDEKIIVQNEVDNNSIDNILQNTEPLVNQDVFSMFGNSENQTNEINQQYNYQSPQSTENQNSKIISPNLKVPISFDIKVTDGTNIEELKAKLRAIKEFINQEF
jgi:pyruvate, water dikinase